MLYLYGTSKLLHIQFDLQSELAHRAVGSLTGYQLTWYYFGFSRVYAFILGLTQVTGATLLLFRKTTLVGALAVLPVMANILLINIFVLVDDYGPYLIAALICMSLVTILWHHRVALVTLFWSSQNSEPEPSERAHRWIRSSIVLACISNETREHGGFRAYESIRSSLGGRPHPDLHGCAKSHRLAVRRIWLSRAAPRS